MKISAKAEYACLAMAELARPGRSVSPLRIREIAEAQAIPSRYLVQILLQLKAAGLVVSARGSDGGYQLARNPRDISVAEVIAAIDGPGEFTPRLDSSAARVLAGILDRTREAERTILGGVSIAQLLAADNALDWVL